jgi:hypothetical protein
MSRHEQADLVEFFRSSPLAEAVAAGELDLARERDPLPEDPFGQVAGPLEGDPGRRKMRRRVPTARGRR